MNLKMFYMEWLAALRSALMEFSPLMRIIIFPFLALSAGLILTSTILVGWPICKLLNFGNNCLQMMSARRWLHRDSKPDKM